LITRNSSGDLKLCSVGLQTAERDPAGGHQGRSSENSGSHAVAIFHAGLEERLQ
jgi:hypothetical protein